MKDAGSVSDTVPSSFNVAVNDVSIETILVELRDFRSLR